MNRFLAGCIGAGVAILLELLTMGFLFVNDGLARTVHVLFYAPVVLVNHFLPVEQDWLRQVPAEEGWRQGLHDHLLLINWSFYVVLGFTLGWWVARRRSAVHRAP
jgi:hypothetical protein